MWHQRTDNKSGRIRTQCVPDRACNNQDAADENTRLSAPLIADPSSGKSHHNSRENKGSSDDAEPITLWIVKEINPVRHGLEAREQRLVI